MYDIIIIGKGPAGTSAGLYAARAGMKTAIISNGIGALEKAHVIENYYGLSKPASGRELQQMGEEQVAALGVELIDAEVTGILQMENFTVESTQGNLECKAVIICTGKARKRIPIGNLKELEGKGVSYCAICDGFFYRGKRVGVLGDGDYALSEAKHLSGFTSEITIFTNGMPLKTSASSEFKVDERKIKLVKGNEKAEGLIFENGEEIELDGLFVAVGQASAADFSTKLGVVVENGNIVVDSNNMTNCPGVFAAGDCIGGLQQASTAVGEGATAGQRASEYVKKLGK